MYKWILSLLLIVSIGSNAQEKLFQEALKKGREKHEFYTGVNNPKKVLTVEKVKEYCAKNNYIVGGITTSVVSRFGDVVHSVTTFEFLPADEYEEYVYYSLINYDSTYKYFEDKKFEYGDHKNVGFATMHLKGKDKSVMLYSAPNTKWTGEVANGDIQGKGVGFYISDNIAVLFKGFFKDGCPVNGKTTFLYYPMGDSKGPIDREEIDKATIEAEEVSDGMLGYVDNGKRGFIGTNGKIAIKPQFDKIIRPFIDGKAIVSRNDTTEIIINKYGAVVGVTENQAKILKERELAKLEQERLKEEQRKKELAEAAERARKYEERRKEAIKNAKEGDMICYSQDWSQSSGNVLVDYIMGRKRYTMKVVCFVEKNVNNGERLQVRISSIESSDGRYYSTPIIDGIKYRLDAVLWIRPLKNKGWWIED